MSDDKNDRSGRRRPPKDTQFKKGQSGNPRGRPRKRVAALIPNQLTKDVLRVMEMPVSVKMPGGETVLTVREATIYSIAKRAIGTDKVSYSKEWLRLQREALEQNVEAHPELLNIDLFEGLLREGCGDELREAVEKSLEALIKKSKGK